MSDFLTYHNSKTTCTFQTSDKLGVNVTVDIARSVNVRR